MRTIDLAINLFLSVIANQFNLFPLTGTEVSENDCSAVGSCSLRSLALQTGPSGKSCSRESGCLVINAEK